MKWNYLISFFTLGLACCFAHDLQHLRNRLNEIPGLENFNDSNLPSIAQVKTAVNDKCKKVGGVDDGYDKIKAAGEQLKTCLQEHIDVSQIEEEVEESKKTGSMDEVFAKYCAKIPTIKECGKRLGEAFKPCLEEGEKEGLRILANITESVVNFACHKDGDRIAMFIAEGGIECLNSKRSELQKCVNDTFGPRIPSDVSINNLPDFSFNEQKCSDLTALQTCVVTELEKCKDYTPANIVDALFKFIRRISPCKK